MATSARTKATRKKGTKKKRSRTVRRKVSRLRKPDEMPLETWQVELRRQFGPEQGFDLKNVGDHPIFSEFHVTNPQSGNTYRVAIRGTSAGDNFCACPDFATNALGTCKHIEFTLAKLARKRGGKTALRNDLRYWSSSPLPQGRSRPADRNRSEDRDSRTCSKRTGTKNRAAPI
ncbi:MAG: SWIM zinc finger family protein [Planctomycetes bacterium]|nr:SWIM zinc finger family protein [Planctomycetota bacterium]